MDDLPAENQRALKRHRARHTKSRNGCYPCKSRRVKCDELQPACGTCSSRGETCYYPSPRISAKKQPRSRREEAGSNDASLSTESLAPSDGRSSFGSVPLAEINATLPAIFSTQSSRGQRDLNMNDLKLLQFYHSHTAGKMSLHTRKALVWKQIIPELASKNVYLMHLLLALAGIHMITHQHEYVTTRYIEDTDKVDLTIIVEHHQRGLQGFREEIPYISPSNAESIFSGSLLLVAFAFASLKVQELNPLAVPPREMTISMGSPSSTKDILRLNWLHLNRGVSSVIGEQWYTLKSSRLRQMVVLPNTDETGKELEYDAPSSRLSHCSQRLVKFAEGARQAVANLRASLNVFDSAENNISSGWETSTSQHSEAGASDWVVEANSGAIDVLDKAYARITNVLSYTVTESPASHEIQLDFEDAAILSWPIDLPSQFLASLERSEHDNLHGFSLIILAHLFLINTLFDTWFMRGSFEREILKVNALIESLHESHLSAFMLWPNEVVKLPLAH